MVTGVVIVSAVRTPIGKLGGELSNVRPDDMAALVIKEAVRRAGIDPGDSEEVYMGCANQAGEDNRNVARMGLLVAGLPNHIAGVTINRLCASSLNAVNQAFAVQSLVVLRELGISQGITNVNGGAIALGHPLGCTGARLLTSLIYEMQRRASVGEKMRYGLATLCVGVGQGEATIIERVSL